MRKGKTLFNFVLAITLGSEAIWLAGGWLNARLAPASSVENDTTGVVIAAVEIPCGQKIEFTQLKQITWPSSDLPEGALLSLDDAEGRIANRTLLPGELVLRNRIVESIGGSAVSATIAPGVRTVTVKVNKAPGVTGFPFPGNRVDVLTSGTKTRRVQTRTLLENIKVLAVDQKSSPGEYKPIVVRTFTPETLPKQAGKMAKATRKGAVQLDQRYPTDDTPMGTATIIRGSAVSDKQL